ncbi:MAG: hypothetical protein NC405_07900 [Odoribacter sp.]|nr:hypothetical protein [Odoribacter sp.]
MSDFDNNNTSQQPRTSRRLPSTKSILGLTFGIFMVIIYVGMGILLMIDFFGWSGSTWGWMRWIVGPVLVVYGFFRGYRQYVMFTQSDDNQ